MNKLKRIGLNLLTGLTGYLAVRGGIDVIDQTYGMIAQYHLIKSYPGMTPGDFEKDLELKFEEIRRSQERKLGIKHFEKQKVSFKPSLIKSKLARAGGMYSAGSNTLWVNVEEGNWVESAIAHELGHAYHDKLNESQGRRSWYIEEFARGPRVVTEGIAEYFENSIFPRNDSPNLSFKDFQSYAKMYGKRAEYEAGYRLVRPILDRGVKKGIEILAQNPPTRDDLKDLRAYQQKILNMMTEEK